MKKELHPSPHLTALENTPNLHSEQANLGLAILYAKRLLN